MFELRAWLQMQLLWDADRDPATLIQQFVAGFYGPIAAPHISAHIKAWEDAISKGASTINRTTWSGYFVSCNKDVPGLEPGSCYDHRWVSIEAVVRSAVALSTAVAELGLESANAEYMRRTQRVQLGSWWIVLMRWEEACTFATEVGLRWPLAPRMNDSLASWETAMVRSGVVFHGGSCPDKSPQGVCWNASTYLGQNTTGRVCQEGSR
jgi:hypothetical protein